MSSVFVFSCICVFVSSVFVDLPGQKESRDGAAEHQAAAAQDHFLSSDGNSLASGVLFICEIS